MRYARTCLKHTGLTRVYVQVLTSTVTRTVYYVAVSGVADRCGVTHSRIPVSPLPFARFGLRLRFSVDLGPCTLTVRTDTSCDDSSESEMPLSSRYRVETACPGSSWHSSSDPSSEPLSSLSDSQESRAAARCCARSRSCRAREVNGHPRVARPSLDPGPALDAPARPDDVAAAEAAAVGSQTGCHH